MKVCQGKIGRVFVIKIEDGDRLPDCITEFALKKQISVGHVLLVGGIGSGQLVVGPRKSDEMPPDPMLVPIDGVHEVVGVGIIAPGEDKKPMLHMHAALGRAGNTVTGCIRPGIETWLIGEAIVYEITDAPVARLKDKKSGFELLDI